MQQKYLHSHHLPIGSEFDSGPVSLVNGVLTSMGDVEMHYANWMHMDLSNLDSVRAVSQVEVWVQAGPDATFKPYITNDMWSAVADERALLKSDTSLPAVPASDSASAIVFLPACYKARVMASGNGGAVSARLIGRTMFGGVQ